MAEERTIETVPDEVFVARWRPKLLYRGFDQVWRSPETGAVTDFAAIRSPTELARASARAEAEWMRQVEALMAGRYNHLRRQMPTLDTAQIERQCRAELAAHDLYYLTKYVLEYDKLTFHLHYFMARTVQDLPPGYRGLRQFARDSYKTTVMGIGYMVQQPLRNHNVRILYKSNAEGNAKNKVAEARNHFLHNALFRSLYPEHVPQRRADEGSEGRWTTPARRQPQQEGTFTAAGVGSSKTSQHYDIIIGDDFWDAKSVTSVEKSATTMRELGELEYLLVSPAEGIINFISTRFAHDDPTGVLERNPEYDCVIVSGILGCGRSVFPESLPLAKMKAQAEDAYSFSCQVILSPSTEALSLPRPKHLRHADLRPLELAGTLATRRVIVTDAAGSKTKTSDEASILTVLLDHLGRLVVIGSVSRKLAPSEFVDVLFEEFDRTLAESVVLQRAAIDTVIVSFIEERNAQRRAAGLRAMPIVRYSLGQEEKKRRITAALQPLLQEGRLYVDPDLPDAVALEREIEQHPNTANDHRLDALAALGDPSIRVLPSPPLASARAEVFIPPTRHTTSRSHGDDYRRELARMAGVRAETDADDREDLVA